METQMENRFPFPLPNGWFAVAWSGDVAPSEVKPLSCFGRELVIFRTESGVAAITDAFCPHLGAHLGHGGTVCGETLRCPFHGWRWNLEGRCEEIPYSQRMPRGLGIETMEVCEKNGVIFAWHHLDGQPPDWEVPAIPELSDSNWTEPEPFEMHIATCCQELVENAFDPAHFVAVHGVDDPPETKSDFSSVPMVSENCTSLATPRGTVTTTIRGESYGLGVSVTRVSGFADMCFLALNTPIDEDNIQLRWAFSVPRVGDSTSAEGVGRAFINEFTRQLEQDKPIWENKRYTSKPMLCDSDGPIAEYRRWTRQFYSNSEENAPNQQ
jgi:phenylpropionate dioxygenase-like ring-hydroxylating dioxygenase large terminal subunit